ncbi:MAG: MBL fold metallo-hydrolase [Candidatus Nomurabacteria bacterium]|jgi:metal-dependent hydrolase (beta-lactamase superfamily II)|nr:MBL fold metallo-hydrolase [Candidatus Nomurabacteria bacterium]
MKITKFDHSCFLLEKDGRGLLFDPVEFTHKLPSITNLDAIIITHIHGDHFQPEVLNKLRQDNPQAKIFTTEDNEALKDVATIALGGDKTAVGVFGLEFYGENHAEIIPGEFLCKNIGTLVDGVFANSGDSFDLPPKMPAIIAAPVAAPWLRLSETMGFLKESGVKIVIPAHDALNSDFGNTVCDNWISKVCTENGAKYKKIHFGEVMEVE